MPANPQHDRLIRLLMDRRRSGAHPSHHMLARIEASLSDRSDVEAYLDLLLSTCEAQRHPSPHLIDRARRITELLVLADRLEEVEAAAPS